MTHASPRDATITVFYVQKLGHKLSETRFHYLVYKLNATGLSLNYI